MHFPRSTLIIAVSLVLLLTLIRPFPVFGISDHQETRGDSLLIGSFVEPTIINPILTHSSISAMLKGIIFDGLIRLDEKMEPAPHLAQSWENSQDGLTWAFHLRKNVSFHDGVELTAEDVKFTFEKIQDPSINSPYISIFKNFENVNVKDRYTVEINLRRPLPSLPFYLEVGILPKHLLMGKDLRKAKFNYHPIGTGPFRMGVWGEDEIVLSANEAYFNGTPYLNRVAVKFFNDQRVVWAELMKGAVDCVFPTYSKNYDIIEKIPDFKIYSFLDPYYYILTFNEENFLFEQKRVRQALNYAVDKERIVEKVLRAKGRVSSGTTYPLSWAFNSEISPYPYNPKEALKLLNEAGWQDTNGNQILDKDEKEFEFVLLFVEGDDVANGCALEIEQQLLDIGIRMRVSALPFAILYKEFLLTKKFNASLLSIISDDPDKNYAWWHSSQVNGGFNVFSYKNEKVDELLDKGRSTLDREQRKRIYHQFQREIHEDSPGIFLFWRDYMIGIHKRFKGVRIGPAGIFNNINEWYVPKDEQKYK